MTYTYTWTDDDQLFLKREDSDGNVVFIPADPSNSAYAKFLASGETAAAYVAPPATADLRTDEEKLEQATGLTVAEIKAVLGV